MDIYQFVWAAFAWTVTFAALWPVNVPAAALAFRIWRGRTPVVDMETDELWKRAALATLCIAVASVAFVGLDWVLATQAELPPGPVHLVVFLGYLPMAVWIVMLFFGLEDFFEGLSLLLLYFYLPVFAIYALNWLLGAINPSLEFWTPVVDYVKGWLPEPPPTT